MAVDRGAIDAQLRDIGEGERWWEQREFRDLPHVLHAGERIRGLTNGKLLSRRRPHLRQRAVWLIVVTDQRILCLKQDKFARKQLDIVLSEVVGIDQKSRLRGYDFLVDTRQQRYRLRIPKADAFRFGGALAPVSPALALPLDDPFEEPGSWLPGASVVAALPGVAGLVAKSARRSTADPEARDQIERLEATVERLQTDMERLRQQVAFLEDLLQTRAEEATLVRSQGDS